MDICLYLALTAVCFLLCNHRKLRKDQIAAKILLHLCASLLCVLIVFVAGVERGGVSENACRIVAALIHYFLLVAFLWMLIEAYFMYQAFVKVFRDYGDYVMWKCAAMGWGESFVHVIDIFSISNILEWFSQRVVISLKNLTPLTQPIKSKTKTIRYLVTWLTNIFPRFAPAICNCFEF